VSPVDPLIGGSSSRPTDYRRHIGLVKAATHWPFLSYDPYVRGVTIRSSSIAYRPLVTESDAYPA